MIIKRLSLSFLFIVIVLLSLLAAQGMAPGILIASPRLPNVTPEIESPEFWIK